MARFKWSSPHDWLGDKINAHAKKAREGMSAQSDADCALSDLVCIANTIVNGEMQVDSDTIQDAFQDEMIDDGYFLDLDITLKLSRDQCVELLEGIGIQCYDNETVETLCIAVQSNIKDGDLSYEDVENMTC